MHDVKQIFAERLKRYREMSGMTRRELASRVNVSPTSIGYYETAEKAAGMETIVAIANVLKVSIDELTGNDFAVAMGECADIGFSVDSPDNDERLPTDTVGITDKDGRYYRFTRNDFMLCMVAMHNSAEYQQAAYNVALQTFKVKFKEYMRDESDLYMSILGIDAAQENLLTVIGERLEVIANSTDADITPPVVASTASIAAYAIRLDAKSPRSNIAAITKILDNAQRILIRGRDLLMKGNPANANHGETPTGNADQKRTKKRKKDNKFTMTFFPSSSFDAQKSRPADENQPDGDKIKSRPETSGRHDGKEKR